MSETRVELRVDSQLEADFDSTSTCCPAAKNPGAATTSTSSSPGSPQMPRPKRQS